VSSQTFIDQILEGTCGYNFIPSFSILPVVSEKSTSRDT
jgi:hypothetical protein